jgi:hypothetical protein
MLAHFAGAIHAIERPRYALRHIRPKLTIAHVDFLAATTSGASITFSARNETERMVRTTSSCLGVLFCVCTIILGRCDKAGELHADPYAADYIFLHNAP